MSISATQVTEKPMIERINTSKLTIGNENINLPVCHDTIGGAKFVLIKDLFKQTGVIVLDSGYSSSAICQSKISYVDGEKGILLCRGYPIEQIAQKGTYLEIVHLLLNGELPTENQLEAFEKGIVSKMAVDVEVLNILKSFPANAHPLRLLNCLINSLSTFYGGEDLHAPKPQKEIALNLIAKAPTIVAAIHRFTHSNETTFIQPRRDLGYTENFLHMCFADNSGCFIQKQALITAMERILILHADHEQNASTAVVRQVGSTGADLYAAISAGIGALGGRFHGGANEAVQKMLQEIENNTNVDAFIKQSIQEKKTLIMGFGHRIYKVCDPRATIMREECDNVIASLGIKNNLFDIAKELEQAALKEPYFIKNKLYPNVDFYSGVLFSALGFSPNMFTLLFSLSRISGWSAQFLEMLEEGPVVIGRPRQNYIGSPRREYVDLIARRCSEEKTKS